MVKDEFLKENKKKDKNWEIKVWKKRNGGNREKGRKRRQEGVRKIKYKKWSTERITKEIETKNELKEGETK